MRGAPESRAEAGKSRPGVGLRRQDWPRTAEAPGREGGVWRAAEGPLPSKSAELGLGVSSQSPVQARRVLGTGGDRTASGFWGEAGSWEALGSCRGGGGSGRCPDGPVLLFRQRPSCCRPSAGPCAPAGRPAAEDPQPDYFLTNKHLAWHACVLSPCSGHQSPPSPPPGVPSWDSLWA